MIELLLDPDKAIHAVNKAVAMVKKAAKAVDNAQSLGPVLGKYFDVKVKAMESMEAARDGKFGASAIGQAIEIELAIHNAEAFEEEIKNKIFYPNHMDLWMKIKAREQQIKVKQAKAAGAAKAAARRKKQQQNEAIEMAIGVSAAVVIVGIALWGLFELVSYCTKHACG